jgi:LmbE family N-acetylglucosaminyl deacetylase
MNVKNKRILILSPHTDDAELGAGGSISRFIEHGNEILWLVFSTASDSIPEFMDKDILKKEFANVYKSLGLNDLNVKVFNFKVRLLNFHRQEVLEELYKLKKEFKPELVIGPSLNDLHQDHKTVAEEMIRAFKSSSSIISYELPWNHLTFNTQMFIKLDEIHINKKIDMLNHYKSQIDLGRFYFSPDFIKGLAFTRGAQINHKYAEAFEVIRWLE